MERERSRVCIVSDGVVAPLGFTTEALLHAIEMGADSLCMYKEYYQDVEPFVGSVFSQIQRSFIEDSVIGAPKDHFSFFEKMLIAAANNALQNNPIDPSSSDTIWILATTKGDIDTLNHTTSPSTVPLLWSSAEKVARYFGNTNRPIVISNACVSGLSAQIVGVRLLKMGLYKNAVVVGGDLVTRFIIAGFQSFKALSSQKCKPFDAAREGLNLGECAAAVVLSNLSIAAAKSCVSYEACAGSNDANHISGPSRNGEGLYRAIEKVIKGIDVDQIAFINTHGTATLYNDQMEAIAIERAGLKHIPVNSFKGYWGHTLGTAGIIETIISARCLQTKLLLPTKGFSTLGVSVPLKVIGKKQRFQSNQCIKTASGFGGCNAAIRLKYNEDEGSIY